jgi:hypothetical protein
MIPLLTVDKIGVELWGWGECSFLCDESSAANGIRNAGAGFQGRNDSRFICLTDENAVLKSHSSSKSAHGGKTLGAGLFHSNSEKWLHNSLSLVMASSHGKIAGYCFDENTQPCHR